MSISPPVKNVVDGASLLNIWAVFVSILPDITAILSFFWILIRLYETRTVQKLLKKTRFYNPDLNDKGD